MRLTGHEHPVESGGELLRSRHSRSKLCGPVPLTASHSGKVPLPPAEVKSGEKPYLIARIGLNRPVLLEAAQAGSCVKIW